MNTLTITPGQFADLIKPVLPFASTDDMLPVLCAIQIRTEGQWLIATATDRFRVAVQRIEKRATDDDPATTWPEFEALIPVRAVKSMLATFKPARRSAPVHEMKMTITDDRISVIAAGSFDLFDNAEMGWALETGSFPQVAGLFREALSTPPENRSPVVGVHPAYLRDFATVGGPVLRIELGAFSKALVATNDDGFIALLMPRRLIDGKPEEWGNFFDEKPEPKPAAKKRASRKKVA